MSQFSDHIDMERMDPRLSNDVVSEDHAAEEFVERFGEDIRYCHSTGSWFVWRLVRWQKDGVGEVFDKARRFARSLGEDQDERGRKVIGKTSFAGGIERFARHDGKVRVEIDYWDADPWLLGTPGGTVDLTTGRLRDSVRSDGVTKSTICAPNDTADCPLWRRFLQETTKGDAELIRFLQQWCGYCLTGVTREHALVFVYGPGGNGKSVFLSVVAYILHEYATMAAMDTFTASHNDKHPTDLAMLRGARMVTASETEEGRAWAESRIKQLTGGDRISARFMRQDFFEFTPAFKLFIVGNHKPILKNVDDAARRRFNIVPFMQKPEQPDRELEQKLKAEAGGILKWMIDGCLDWQQNNLVKPASVSAATNAYFSEQDLFGQWIEDCCDVQLGNPRIWDKSADLFESWSEYAHKAGDEPGTKKAFGQAMQRQSFEPYRVPSVGTRAFRFVRLLTISREGVTRDAS